MSFRIYSNKIDLENKNVLINFRETDVKIPDPITRIKNLIKSELSTDSSISKTIVDNIFLDPTFSKNMFDSVKDVFKLDITQRINSTDFINNKLYLMYLQIRILLEYI